MSTDRTDRPVEHLVVVGASLAGSRAVESARRAGFAGRITLIGAEDLPPYDRLPLSKKALHDDDFRAPVFHDLVALRDDLGVDVRLGSPATGLNPAGRTVTVDTTEIGYDALIVASGSRPRALPVGICGSARRVRSLRTWADAVAVRSALSEGARTVVLGGGFIGAEVAAAARRRGLPATVVEAAPTLLSRSVGSAVGELLTELHARAGTDVRLGRTVQQTVTDDGRLTAVVLDDGSRIPADLLVVGVGTEPATDWLDGSGIERDDQRALLCDTTLRTSDPAVFAAGDVAAVPHPRFGDLPLRPQHWASAAEQGALAARNALNPASARQPLDSIPSFWSDWYEHRVQVVGVMSGAEVTVVDERPDSLLAIGRDGNRVVGALTVNRPRQIMKLRRLIATDAPWADAVQLATDFAELSATAVAG